MSEKINVPSLLYEGGIPYLRKQSLFVPKSSRIKILDDQRYYTNQGDYVRSIIFQIGKPILQVILSVCTGKSPEANCSIYVQCYRLLPDGASQMLAPFSMPLKREHTVGIVLSQIEEEIIELYFAPLLIQILDGE